MLDQSKTKFGPHALKLAEDFIQNQQKAKEAREIPDTYVDDQEKISFLMMEYFLYGIVEADHVINDI